MGGTLGAAGSFVRQWGRRAAQAAAAGGAGGSDEMPQENYKTW